jgi:hypothetical protein
MSKDGALAEFLTGLTPEWIAERGSAGRERTVAVYAKDVVIRRMIEYYETIDRRGI